MVQSPVSHQNSVCRICNTDLEIRFKIQFKIRLSQFFVQFTDFKIRFLLVLNDCARTVHGLCTGLMSQTRTHMPSWLTERIVSP